MPRICERGEWECQGSEQGPARSSPVDLRLLDLYCSKTPILDKERNMGARALDCTRFDASSNACTNVRSLPRPRWSTPYFVTVTPPPPAGASHQTTSKSPSPWASRMASLCMPQSRQPCQPERRWMWRYPTCLPTCYLYL